MSELPDPQAPVKQAKRVSDAYAEVFGLPETRTEAQRLVMSDIEGFCRAYQLCVELRTDGSLAERNHLLNEGRRSVWLRIRGQVIASTAPKPGPLTISRKRKPTTP